ncbi:MAG: zinc-ribbon domain-containing protein [Candidatus Bathyarchaeota archaeon]|nr:zinc-ribbon domain-containing protein [Candidatus Bathyarchaeota archaeon]
MVYCTRCGTQNEEGARFCVNCGASLYPKKRGEKEEGTCFGPKEPEKEECFGLPYGGAIVGIIFGVFIILLGFATWLGYDIWRLIGPSAAIVIGILIVAGAIYGLRRRSKPEASSANVVNARF